MDAQKMGAFIAQCRKEKQMTQEQLAQRLQVTDKAVSRWERGVGFPDITTIEPLAQALGVEVLELMHAQRLKKPDNSNSKTEQAVHDILQLAQEQRRQERKKIALLLAGVLTALLLLLVLDVLDWQWEAILFTGLGAGAAAVWPLPKGTRKICPVLLCSGVRALSPFTVVCGRLFSDRCAGAWSGSQLKREKAGRCGRFRSGLLCFKRLRLVR